MNGTSRREARNILGMTENTFNTTYIRVIQNCKKILKNEQKKNRFLLNKLNKRIRRLENDISKNKKLNKNVERRANRKAHL